MVNEEPSADSRAGVNLDACEQSAGLGNDPRYQRQAEAMQPVGETVQQDSVKPRVTENDLKDALGGRVLTKDRLNLFPNNRDHCALHYRRFPIVRVETPSLASGVLFCRFVSGTILGGNVSIKRRSCHSVQKELV